MSSDTYSRPRDCNGFEVAIISASSLEAGAMMALFDDFWEQDQHYYVKSFGDMNSYTTGRLGPHHVVLVHMPDTGEVSTADVAADLLSTFPSIRLALLVGVCGGVPFVNGGKGEVTLGDIVIGTRIVQLDPVASLEDQLRTDTVALFNTENPENPPYPGVHEDKLFEKTYRHKHQDAQACAICANCINPEDSVCEEALDLSCAELGCATNHIIPRVRIQNAIKEGSGASGNNPRIYFGAIASGDQVIKSAWHRDRIATQDHVIAFEMEAAGVEEHIPTIVVKGVCDYADGHSDQGWKHYAAATAAVCAKNILEKWKPVNRPTSYASILFSRRQVLSGTHFCC